LPIGRWNYDADPHRAKLFIYGGDLLLELISLPL
jgi:hypothetical protein